MVGLRSWWNGRGSRDGYVKCDEVSLGVKHDYSHSLKA